MNQATPDFNQALADQLTATRQAEAKAFDHEQTVKRQRAEIAALIEANLTMLHIIGAHTPIAAFDLATTWDAVKAMMQDEIAELIQERDALKVQLNRSLPDDFATLDEYIRVLNEENNLFTFQAAEARFLLREILAKDWTDMAVLVPRIRAVLDDPPGAVKREREYKDQLQKATAERDPLRDALQRYVNTDNCEYGDGPPCPGDPPFVPECLYCQACAALGEG